MLYLLISLICIGSTASHEWVAEFCGCIAKNSYWCSSLPPIQPCYVTENNNVTNQPQFDGFTCRNATPTDNTDSLTVVDKIVLVDQNIRCPLPQHLPKSIRVLDLSDNYFHGTLPEVWGESITNIEIIQLSNNGNALKGTLPNSWANLTVLQTLLLDGNGLVGTLPDSWSHLQNLQDIVLKSNQFRGAIPASWSVLQNLQVFSIEQNLMSFPLPSSWGMIKSLKGIYAHQNSIPGTLPEEWGNIASLQTVYLGYNQLSGTIPRSWGSLSQLAVLYIPNNIFSGTLPNEIGMMSSLQQLVIYSNQLTGTLPPSFGSLRNLNQLLAGGNGFAGTLPEEWSNMVNLTTLDLTANNIVGLLPSRWGLSMSLLQTIRLDLNWLQGFIPCTWSNMTSLETLSISSCNLTLNETFDSTNCVFSSVVNLYMGNNKMFGGILAKGFGALFPSLRKLGMQNTRLRHVTDLPPRVTEMDVSGNPLYDFPSLNLSLIRYVDITPTTMNEIPPFPEGVYVVDGVSVARTSPYTIQQLSVSPQHLSQCGTFFAEWINRNISIEYDGFLRPLLRFSSFNTSIVNGTTVVDWQTECSACLVEPRFVVQVTPRIFPETTVFSWSGVATLMGSTLGDIAVLEYPVLQSASFGVNYVLSLTISVRDQYSMYETHNTLWSRPFNAPICTNVVLMAIPNSTKCFPCPNLALCNGTVSLKPSIKAWRPYDNVLPFYACEANSGCDRHSDGTKCKANYVKGPHNILCYNCTDGFHHAFRSGCVPCGSKYVNGFLLSMCILGLLSYVTASMIFTLRPRGTRSKLRPFIMSAKMLLNHFILVSFAWSVSPNIFRRGKQQTFLFAVSVMQDAVGSLSFIREEMTVCLHKFSLFDQLRATGIFLAIILGYIIVVALGAALKFPLVFPSPLYTILGGVAIVLQAMHMTVSKVSVDSLRACDTFSFWDTHTWGMRTFDIGPPDAPPKHLYKITRDRTMSCLAPEYHTMITTGWTILSCVGFGAPLFLWLTLTYVRKIDGHNVASYVFDFLVGNFRHDVWFWEILLSLRKLLGVAVLILEQNLQPPLLYLFYLFCLVIQLLVKPYNSYYYNQLEVLSLSIGLITLNANMVAESMSSQATNIRSVLEYSVVFVYCLGTVGVLLCIYKHVKSSLAKSRGGVVRLSINNSTSHDKEGSSLRSSYVGLTEFMLQSQAPNDEERDRLCADLLEAQSIIKELQQKVSKLEASQKEKEVDDEDEETEN